MPEHIAENNLAVNQAARLAFVEGHERLPGLNLYILEAMLWGLNNGAAEWADDNQRYEMETQVGLMLIWKPSEVMGFLYDDGDGGFDESQMEDEAGSFDEQSPADVASLLLETLNLQLG